MSRKALLRNCNGKRGRTAMLLALSFANSIFVLQGYGQSTATPSRPMENIGTSTRLLSSGMPKREAAYYGLFWGVDELRAKAVESGELIRFSYRVLDANKAKALNDKKIDAFLLSKDGHAKLVVPSLEKVGQLRQTNTPEAGKSYWMAFSNPGRTVRRGDRVSVVIGHFHVEGLLVE